MYHRRSPRYLATEAEWSKLADWLLARPGMAIGWDTEFHGADLSRTSTDTVPGRARVHVWSVGFRTSHQHPRGYRIAESVVLPLDALAHAGLVAWLRDGRYRKIGLNTLVDVHATETTWLDCGVEGRVEGWEDLLGRARYLLPERVPSNGGRGFGLDRLGTDLLGRGKIDSYEEVLSEPNVIDVERRKTSHRMVCECGAQPCRRRTGPGHVRSRVTDVQRWNETVERGTRLIPLASVVPGHERFPRLVAYSGVDSELAVELDEVFERLEKNTHREVPW